MKGYTLIEAVVAVLLMAIVLLGGTTLLYQSLKTTGLSDIDSNLENSLQSILRGIDRDIRFGEVIAVDDATRSDCLEAGETGYLGSSLRVANFADSETVYSLINSKIASTSSETSRVTYLNPDEVTIVSLDFTWYCLAGVSDKIKLMIEASSSALGTGIVVNKSVSTEINLLNSGLN